MCDILCNRDLIRDDVHIQSRYFGDDGGGYSKFGENQKIQIRVTTGGGIAPRERHGYELRLHKIRIRFGMLRESIGETVGIP